MLWQPPQGHTRSPAFVGVTSLVTGLLEAREDRKLERLLKQPGRQDLLILDELGYVPFTKAGAELLFEVVSRAYERQSMVVTTNLPFEQWVEVSGYERGNMIRAPKPHSLATGWTCKYDAWNRLVEVKSDANVVATYEYDLPTGPASASCITRRMSLITVLGVALTAATLTVTLSPRPHQESPGQPGCRHS